MERINKHNYEAFFLDFIEGNLNADEQNDLFVFLAENPELKAAFDGDFSEVVLTPQKNVFAKKSILKVEDQNVLSLNTVDFWMIESVEGNLISSKEKELQEFIKKHRLEKTFATYQATILEPNSEEIYAEKRRLKVPAGIIIPLYVRVASIAAVGIILISLAFNNFGSVGDVSGKAHQKNGAFAQIAKIVFPVIIEDNLNYVSDGVYTDKGSAQTPLEDSNPDRNRRNHSEASLQFNDNQKENLISFQEENSIEDSVKNLIIPFDKEEKIADNFSQDTLPADDVVIPEIVKDDVAQNVFKTEEPFKLITDLASNVTNREISFSRDKDLASNEYVGYQFKLGSFEFERKK